MIEKCDNKAYSGECGFNCNPDIDSLEEDLKIKVTYLYTLEQKQKQII